MLGHISTYLVGVQREGCNKIIYNYIPCDIRTGARNCFFELAICHPVSHSHESRHRIRSGIYRWDLCWYPTLTWLVGFFVRPKEYTWVSSFTSCIKFYLEIYGQANVC